MLLWLFNKYKGRDIIAASEWRRWKRDLLNSSKCRNFIVTTSRY